MTKWEVLMDGPDQSIYAVCCRSLTPWMRHEECLLILLRAVTLSSRLPFPTNTPSSHQLSAFGPRSTTPT